MKNKLFAIAILLIAGRESFAQTLDIGGWKKQDDNGQFV